MVFITEDCEHCGGGGHVSKMMGYPWRRMGLTVCRSCGGWGTVEICVHDFTMEVKNPRMQGVMTLIEE